MPIAIDVPYSTYEQQLREGHLQLPDGKRCPREGTATLALSTTVVVRALIVLQRDRHGELRTVELTIRVALARCSSCKGRWRVLPSDVLPHKLYGLCVIEVECTAYSRGGESLRDVAWSLRSGERTPAHTTLHAWTEGMGSWALGFEPGRVPGTEPVGALLAETRRRWPGEVETILSQRAPIDPRRYRSEERRERLVAVTHLLAIAAAIAEPDDDRPLCSWFGLAQAPVFGLLLPASFRTGLSCTPFGLGDPEIRDALGPTSLRRGPPCPTNTRSPPGATSRSLHSSIQASIARQNAARYGTGPNTPSFGPTARRSA